MPLSLPIPKNQKFLMFSGGIERDKKKNEMG